MGRRSLQAERKEQILVAFERCVAAHGLEGTTLERVAAFAGLGRPAIRHNIGNRDALIAAALERIVQKHEDAYASLVDGLPATGRGDAVLRYLFGGPFSSGDPDEEDMVLDELFALRHRDADIAVRLDAVYRRLQQTLASVLVAEHSATAGACRRVAYLVMALAYGHSTFQGLGVGKRRSPAAFRAAQRMVDELRST